jgi:DNA-binding CsgD family transcriptional regulator
MDLLEREGPLHVAVGEVERARRGEGRILLISGEAGIGKSALIRELVAHVDAESPGQRVFQGGCEDLFSPRPLGPLRDIALAQRGALLQALDDGRASAAVSCFFDLLNTGAVSSVVVFEDVQWADEATFDLIKILARRIGHMPVLLVLSYRDDEIGAEHPLQRVLGDLPSTQLTRIALQPLSPTAVEELAAREGRPGAGLHAATGGNPFYVTEVLASGVDDAARGVPSTVRDAVHTRVARLSPAQREALEALSVVPGRVDPWLAQALLSPQGMEALDACIGRGMLIATDGTLAFRHEIARRAVVDTLAPMLRRSLHARVLDALTAAPPGVATAHASRLAHHAAEAGDAARVLTLAPRAAREAARMGAHREAALELAAALRFADSAPLEVRAELYENWSYEAGLSLAIDAKVIDARHQAVTLWRRLGRADKVGLNLRWLSRLHWYLGQSVLAEQYAEEAVATLEPLPPSPELAWAYSVRSQLYMLRDCTEPAVQWGQRAIDLAESFDEREILSHALNNVGTAELFAGRADGWPKLERSLELARQGGFHEQAARVYTNASEHSVVFKDFPRAERWLAEGIAFDREHDLDAWTHYLVGWQAQLRLDQGRFDEAESLAQGVLALPRLTPVMRLPALTVLACVRMRRGDPEGDRLLGEALDLAKRTGEAQRLAPVATAIAEGAWLRGDPSACLAALRHLDDLPGTGINPWAAGEIAAWRRRAGDRIAEAPSATVGPWRLELQGDPAGAADAWQALGAPNEAALALLRAAQQSQRDAAAPLLIRALEICESIGARLAAARVRGLAREWRIEGDLPARKRGPYARARLHPRGLSGREQEVLSLLACGMSNADIALQLGAAQRTVEHHVTAVLRKLSAADRGTAVEIARRERLLAPL